MHVALNHATHRALRVNTAPSPRFGDNVNFIGVIPREFTRLVAEYPLFLRKNGQTGQFEPGALLGFSAGENLYLVNERWDADYVPLHVQRQPFLIARNGDGAVVTIDTDSPRVQAEEGEGLFHEDGRATDYLQRVTSVLQELAGGTRAGYDYGARLAEFDLVEPVRIDVEFVDHSEVRLQGLYAINAEKLQALAGDRLVALRDEGLLTWAYFQLASMSQISRLVARKNRLISGLV